MGQSSILDAILLILIFLGIGIVFITILKILIWLTFVLVVSLAS